MTLRTDELDARVVRWLAHQIEEDLYARLVDGGADADEKVRLDQIYVDLQFRPRGASRGSALQTLLQRQTGNPDQERGGRGPFCVLIVAGPGMGKSTLTTMLAQVLRARRVRAQVEVLDERERAAFDPAGPELLKAALPDTSSGGGELPLRIDLPRLAAWLEAGTGDVWAFLAARCRDSLGAEACTGLDGPLLRTLCAERPLAWIFDGLDEVAPAAGRPEVLRLIGEVAAAATPHDAVIVATRPQNEGGELDCGFQPRELAPLGRDAARSYLDRLLTTWARVPTAEAAENVRERLDAALSDDRIGDLLTTPLHATMAALLLARHPRLPAARAQLFKEYFDTVLNRELRKPTFKTGLQEQDREVLRELHHRVGLLLHVRAQASGGSGAGLRYAELRAVLRAVLASNGYEEDAVRHHDGRLLGFARDRLVLLLARPAGDYAFNLRSLQEYFAAMALADGSPDDVRARIEAVLLDRHWANVLRFYVSRYAAEASNEAHKRLEATALAACRRLVEPNASEAAPRLSGPAVRIALEWMAETESCAQPRLKTALRRIAVAGARSPSQLGRWSLSWQDLFEPGTLGGEIHRELGRLAWGSVGRERSRQAYDEVLGVARSLFEEGRLRRAAWLLIWDALLADDPETVALAKKNAPASLEEVRALLGFGSVEDGASLTGWPRSLLEDHLHLLSPGDLSWELWRSVPPWLASTRLAHHHFATATGRLSLYLAGNYLHTVGVGDDLPGPLDLPGAPALGAAWTPWLAVERFLRAPSAAALAEVMDTVVDDAALDALLGSVTHFPWPLACTLRSCATAADAVGVAEHLRAGALGDAAEWRAAEARWLAQAEATPDELIDWLEAEGPWGADIGARGRAFPLRDRLILPVDLVERIGRDLAKAEVPSWKHLLLLDCTTNARRIEWVEAAERSPGRNRLLWLLAVARTEELAGAEADRWFGVMHRAGRRSFVSARPESRDTGSVLLRRLESNPEQWGVMVGLAAVTNFRAVPEIRGARLPAIPADAPPLLKNISAWLKLIAGPVDAEERRALVAQLGACTPETEVRFGLAGSLAAGNLPRQAAMDLLVDLIEGVEPNNERLLDRLVSALAVVVGRFEQAAFCSVEAWRRYGLPDPAGLADPQPRQSAHLRRLDALENLRLFARTPVVKGELPEPPRAEGQLIVLVGENGSGKTTLLRALALVLAAPDVAGKLLDGPPMLRNGQDGRVAVTLDTGRLEIQLKRADRTEIVVPSGDGAVAPRPWVVGYGVRRGNARGEKDRDPETGPIGELHTLFDRPASMYAANLWLRDVEAEALREEKRSGQGAPDGPRRLLWKAAQKALRALLQLTDVEIDDNRVMVTHPQFGRVRMDALSDGYLTTAGWCVDLLARFVDRQRELDEPLGPDLLGDMEGFVLLDEIDLHLHPVWQMRILADVRALFPRLSFIVSTHNPLTLLGARPGEVFVMRRAEDGGVELVQRDLQPGGDIERVLREHFGLQDTFDAETRALLSQHADHISRGLPPEAPERVAIEQKLRDRLGTFGALVAQDRAHGAPQDDAWLDSLMRPGR